MKKPPEKKELQIMQQIHSILIALNRKLDKKTNMSGAGLTTRQYMAVLAIHQSPGGESSMINIANKLGTTKQNINQIIPALERKGYVTRTVSVYNRRMACIKVTETGMKAMRSYSGIGARALTEIFRNFSVEEMEAFLSLMQKLYSD